MQFPKKKRLDVDDCQTHRCQNDAACHDGINTYSCQCPPGWSGTYCESSKIKLNLKPMKIILIPVLILIIRVVAPK